MVTLHAQSLAQSLPLVCGIDQDQSKGCHGRQTSAECGITENVGLAADRIVERVKFRPSPVVAHLVTSTSSGEIQAIPAAAAMTAGQQEILRTVVTEACVDMFTSYGFATRILDLSEPVEKAQQNLVGFIGFVGLVRGSLLVSAPAGLFRVTHPELGSKTNLSKADLFDWTGEMANQLLGRVKRRFCALGRDFHVSTPTAIEGRELVRRFPVRAGVLDLALLVGGHVLAVCFEVTPPTDGLVFPDPAQPMEVSSEGDVVLF